jgi:hypothetical protein
MPDTDKMKKKVATVMREYSKGQAQVELWPEGKERAAGQGNRHERGP